MAEKFTVLRTHKYTERDIVLMQAEILGDFADLCGQLSLAFGIDNPEESDWYILDQSRGRIRFQCAGNRGETEGGRMEVMLTELEAGKVRLDMAPNHNIWDSNRSQLGNVARTIRYTLG